VKLGFLTACFPHWTLDEVVRFACQRSFQTLEVAAWPQQADRPFTATHVKPNELHAGGADRLRTLFEDHRLEMSSLAFYGNNLDPDPREREATNAHVLALIDAAAELGCPTVGTFVGRDHTKTVAQNLAMAAKVFAPLVDRAGERGVKIVIENCVMEGWHPDGYPGNLAYSPELWEWMFDLGLYLNYDPSHLIWMGIDPVAAVEPYVHRVAHAQAKDIEVFPEKRNRYGYPGKAVNRPDPWDVGWWRYRVPGRGVVDWTRVVDVLDAGGYTGALSIEHEDPVWGGTVEKTQAGLDIASRTLRPLLQP
jgi:sugar phosphate isomerase/epimerase